jgi:hypothetical protein
LPGVAAGGDSVVLRDIDLDSRQITFNNLRAQGSDRGPGYHDREDQVGFDMGKTMGAFAMSL